MVSTPSRILIVDDEPNVRLMFRTTLESPAYTISEAVDGTAALDALINSPVDLVMLDHHMPNLDGMATLRGMRRLRMNVFVVIVTAHGSVPDAVEAMKLGAIDFLSKPVTPEALRRVVSEVLARNSIVHAPSSAKAADEPALATLSGQFVANLAKAKRALNQSRFDEAEVFLIQATALDSKSAEANNLMGVLRELKGQNDDAYSSYRAALKSDKHYEPAMHNMTRYYERFTFGSSKVPLDLGDE